MDIRIVQLAPLFQMKYQMNFLEEDKAIKVRSEIFHTSLGC